MKLEDKQLLLKDLCARLPYNVIVHLEYDENTSVTREMGLGSLHDIMFDSAEGKPYLRPMSSITEEEKKEYNKVMFQSERYENDYAADIDWLNARHFDYRGLIKKGLAIEVTEKNNPYKN